MFRFEAKLSETETVSLRFASVSRNHKSKVSLRKFRFVSLKKCFASVVSLKKNFASKVETVDMRQETGDVRQEM